MQKLKLESLQVESFTTTSETGGVGSVQAHVFATCRDTTCKTEICSNESCNTIHQTCETCVTDCTCPTQQVTICTCNTQWDCTCGTE